MKHLEKNPWVRVQKTREQQPFGISQAGVLSRTVQSHMEKGPAAQAGPDGFGSISAGRCGP